MRFAETQILSSDLDGVWGPHQPDGGRDAYSTKAKTYEAFGVYTSGPMKPPKTKPDNKGHKAQQEKGGGWEKKTVYEQIYEAMIAHQVKAHCEQRWPRVV